MGKGIINSMNNYYLLPKFFTESLDPEYQWPDHERSTLGWYYQSLYNKELIGVMHPELLQWCQRHNLTMNSVHLFRAPPMSKQDIHVDGDGNPSLYAINWILSARKSKMIWYQPQKSREVNGHNELVYHSWHEDECDEIERFEDISVPVLLNTEIPHRVVNDTDEWRFCVSIRFPNEFRNWEHAVEFFQPFM